MQITLNGRSHDLPDSASLRHLVERFCKDARHVIAEVNGQIVKAATWDEHALKNGDTVELVNFVGGG